MKLGILSDAHGSIGAFEIALGELRCKGAERFVYLGDAVGYIPDPAVAERVCALGMLAVRGNHEVMMISENGPTEREAVYQLGVTRAAMSDATLAYICRLPASIRMTLDNKAFLFVHGSPADPTSGYVYPDTDLAPFADADADAVFMGHTHRPFVRRSGDIMFVNVGSCALPRDDDPRGAACLFDTSTGEAEILRFDIADASRKTLDRYALHETAARALRRLATAKASV